MTAAQPGDIVLHRGRRWPE